MDTLSPQQLVVLATFISSRGHNVDDYWFSWEGETWLETLTRSLRNNEIIDVLEAIEDEAMASVVELLQPQVEELLDEEERECMAEAFEGELKWSVAGA